MKMRRIFLALGVLAAIAAGCASSESTEGGQTVQIAVTENGFEPAVAVVKQGKPVTLMFTRKTEQTCATEVVFPSLGRRQSLPLNRTVRVRFTPARAESLHFICGMDMVSGTIVVR